MDSLIQDLRFALRSMLRAPGFTAIAVVTLALGIGATTAVFSVLDRAILRPLPVDEPGRLVQIAVERGTGADASINWNLSYPLYVDARDRAGVFTGAVAHTPLTLAMVTSTGVDRLEGAAVSAGFFTTLGVRLAMGRDIMTDEDQPGAGQPVVVLAHDVWQRRFGADAAILGQSVTLNGRPYTVIGVAPAAFRGLVRGAVQQAWVPITTSTQAGDDPFTRRTVSWLDVIARLEPGVTVMQARAAVGLLSDQLTDAGLLPRANRFVLFEAGGGLKALVSQLGKPLAVLMGAVVLVLLVACANVAGLLLARATARRREIAIRLSVGAGRGRLVRQLVTESVLLAAIAGGAGVLLAAWLMNVMPSVPTLFGTPLQAGSGIDGRILAFAASAAALTTLVFGLVPAFKASRPEVVADLKDAGAPPAGGRLRLGARDLLVIGQVAVSLVLLAGGGVLVRSAQNLRAVDPGYDPRRVLLAGVDLDGRNLTGRQIVDFWDRLLERLNAAPGVEAASVALTMVPNPGGSHWDGVLVEGYAATPERPVGFEMNAVGPRYFEALQINLVRGRGFTFSDRPGAPRVAVINEAMARAYWPDQDPVGKRIYLGEDTTAVALQIVGVARDGKYRSLREEPQPAVFRPALQSPVTPGIVIVRTAGDPVALVGLVRSAVRELEPAVPLFDVRTLETHLAQASARERLLASVGALFGALALVLAAVGLFGLLAFSVARRTREIGVRLALGARRIDVTRMVIVQGAARVGLGAVLGTLGAFGATRLLQSLLFGVRPADPVAFGGAVLLLLITSIVAAWLPARRAAAVDPMIALRND